jgi:aminoglycoside phosphotransferase (APT) family kinase protein
MIAGFRMGWPVVLEQFGDLVPEAARKIGDRYADNVPRLLEEMCSAPVCLNHADVRLDNVFFDAEAIALVDWQSICRSAPEQDVAYFITQSVPKAVRARQDLVAYYHGELTRRGVDYRLEDCRRRYEVAALYLMSYAVVIAGTLDMGNERGVQLARTLLDGCMSALDELDAFRLIR